MKKLLYCEMVDCEGFELKKTEPVLIAWTIKLLKKRVNVELENGGFGTGKLLQKVHKILWLMLTGEGRYQLRGVILGKQFEEVIDKENEDEELNEDEEVNEDEEGFLEGVLNTENRRGEESLGEMVDKVIRENCMSDVEKEQSKNPESNSKEAAERTGKGIKMTAPKHVPEDRINRRKEPKADEKIAINEVSQKAEWVKTPFHDYVRVLTDHDDDFVMPDLPIRKENDESASLDTVPHSGASEDLPLDVCRVGRQRKPGDAMKSPFVREITRSEIIFCSYVFECEGEDNEILFKWENAEGNKTELASLYPGFEITSSVLDIWACILNKKEELRANKDFLRFFCTTNTTLDFKMLSIRKYHSIERQHQLFENALDGLLARFPDVNMSKISMLLFPVYNDKHFILVCFDFKRTAIDILDSQAFTINLISFSQCRFRACY